MDDNDDEELLVKRIYKLEEAIKKHKKVCLVSDCNLFSLIEEGRSNYYLPEYHVFMKKASDYWHDVQRL
jgi:hypothetical protein